MTSTESVCAGVRQKIARYRKRKKRLQYAAGIAALGLCAFGALAVSDVFGPALPAAGQSGAEALNEAGALSGAAASLKGESFTLEAAAQDDRTIYLLLTTGADTEFLNGLAFLLRPAALADPPAGYLPSNCGFAFYQPAAGGGPARFLLCHRKGPGTQGESRLALWLYSRNGDTGEAASLAFGLEQTAGALEYPVEAAFTGRDGQTCRFDRITLTPFCTRLEGPAVPLPAEAAESYPCELAVGDTSLAATAHWFVEGGQAGLIVEWQAAVDPAQVSALVLNGIQVTW